MFFQCFPTGCVLYPVCLETAMHTCNGDACLTRSVTFLLQRIRKGTRRKNLSQNEDITYAGKQNYRAGSGAECHLTVTSFRRQSREST